MWLREILAQSWQSLVRNRLRAILTMLGITWGLATVVLLLGYGKGVGETVLKGFLGIGNNVVMIWGGQTSMQAGGERAGRRIRYKYEDVQAVRDEVPLVKAVSAETDTNLAFKHGTRVISVSSKAIQFPYGAMRKLEVEQGRYFEEADFTDHRRVVIFGQRAAKKVFGGINPVGEAVSVNGQMFEVIGLLKLKIQDSSNNGPDNENAFIPFETLRDISNIRDPDMIVFQPVTPELHRKALESGGNRDYAVLMLPNLNHLFQTAETGAISEYEQIEETLSVSAMDTVSNWILKHTTLQKSNLSSVPSAKR